jgi:hypothetical protein
MSQILLAIDGPSPNVGSGATAPYGKATDTLDGVSTEGTGVSLGANGIVGGTMSDQTNVVVPSTRPVEHLLMAARLTCDVALVH